MITYQRERYNEVIEDIKPLLEEHYKEIALYQDHIELNPNYAMYEAMDQIESLHIYTARDDGKLIGYVVSFLQNHPHYMDHNYVINDILYVAPEHRHSEVAVELLEGLEKIMVEEGASVMTFHMKAYKTFETLMDFLGYDKAEFLYSKFIGKDR
jgi:GNAT superfamily N-acetyltransferase